MDVRELGHGSGQFVHGTPAMHVQRDLDHRLHGRQVMPVRRLPVADCLRCHVIDREAPRRGFLQYLAKYAAVVGAADAQRRDCGR